jgi:glutaredoxin
MPHLIEVFTGGCSLCREVVNIVTVGKCRDCIMRVFDVDSGDEEVKMKRKLYKITAVPTIVVDGRIKVVGVPDFPWFCGDDFYRFLEKNFPL